MAIIITPLKDGLCLLCIAQCEMEITPERKKGLSAPNEFGSQNVLVEDLLAL